jgi:CubicO group peptidase (beta-lactamase class C family)
VVVFCGRHFLGQFPGENPGFPGQDQTSGVANGRGRTYSQMLDHEIFAPIKMRDTSLEIRKDLEARYCPITAAWSAGGVLRPETVEGMNLLMRMPGAEIPGGGAVSTMENLFRFVEMLRNGGELDGARIFSRPQ